ncbi:LysR family transcriptional regulator [Sphingobium sp. V4]|uniref:LysR family transcriptional regulator n=1 Tax=Sphingobium sp. V4 TaxID=3038927 RepID=UPI002557ED7C|nr:LysR family transcriptional regulator [Sphingobium sp. V4]WIW89530.1 LysR family transcriptional regulator [Sphingobium sp. V4]
MHITDSKVLRQCLKIGELQSVSRAAEALNVAQPWLSTRLRDYERELGFDLFDRSRRRISLTAEGTQFVEAARVFLNAADRLTAAVHAIRATSHQTTIEIGCLPSASGVVERDQLIEAFQRRFPDVTARIHLLTAPEILESLATGRLDIAFMHSPFPKAMHVSASVPVKTQYAALFMPKEWGYREGTLVGLPELSGREFAAMPAGLHPELCGPVYEKLRQSGIVLHEMPDNSPLALQNFAMSQGIGAITSNSFADYLNKISGYGIWRIKNDPFRSDLCVIEPLPASKRVAGEFWEFAQQKLGEAIPGNPA